MVATRDVSETITELPDIENPAKDKPSIWRRIWPERDAEHPRLLGVPVRWLLVIGLATSAAAIILCSVLATVLPMKKSPRFITGNYTVDAPFREIFRSNFPDPALLRHNGTWYVYGTNNAAGIIDSSVHGKVKDLGLANVQLASSTNFLDWTLHDQAAGPLQELGEWVTKDQMPAEADKSVQVRAADVWAPDILRRADGKFVLYYSATSVDGRKKAVHCVGASVSDEPTGPFKPEAQPIACPIAPGGAIDPGVFTDSDGTIYLSYKIDGNLRGKGGECGNTKSPRKDTPILLQKMEKDGVTKSGEPVTILDRTGDDGPLVEAPALTRSDEGIYFLFFSSGCTWNPSYNVKYATSTSISGPYTRASEPLLGTGSGGLLAPGSPTVWRDDDTWRMAFHARLYTDLGGIRAMYVSNLTLKGTTATLEAPE